MKAKRVTDMSRGAQQFRRKVLRMLGQWGDAQQCRLSYNRDDTTTLVMQHTVSKLALAVEELR